MLGRLEFLGPPPVKNLSPSWVSIEAKYEESHFTEWGAEALRGDTTCPENKIDIRIHACVSPKLTYLLCLSLHSGGTDGQTSILQPLEGKMLRPK